MVDYKNLRKKFPVRKSALPKSRKVAAIKAIAKEYELKKAELGIGPPQFKRGFPYYMVIIIGLMLVGGLVGSAIFEKGGIDISEKNIVKARKSVRNLAIALGRYRYHVGSFPTTEEGLEQLSVTRSSVPGWVGPYIKAVKDDPWKSAYVYVYNGEGSFPTLFSKGPDGEAGTADDVMANAGDFEEPFRDTSWTERWVPWHLRDIILADSKAHKVIIERQVEDALAKDSIVDGGIALLDGWSFRSGAYEAGDVALPHDWMAYGTAWKSGETKGVYARTIEVDESLKGRFIALRLESVAGEPKAALDGKPLAVRNAGLCGYEIDLTDHIVFGGKNEISVEVTAVAGAGRAGIVGPVVLVAEAKDRRVVYGSLKIDVRRADENEAEIKVERLLSGSGNGGTEEVRESKDFVVAKPRLWFHAKPRMNKGNMSGRYAIQALEALDGTSVLLNSVTTGIRCARMDCSFGLTGGAYFETVAYARLRRLKDAGVNAVAVSDAAMPASFKRLCDDTGMLLLGQEDVRRLKLDEDRIADASGDPDDAFYCSVRSRFVPESKAVHLSDWTPDAENKVDLRCIAAGDAAKLYVNGEFRGDGRKMADSVFSWNADYEEGEAKVIVYKRGVYFTEAVAKTALPAGRLAFRSSQATVLAEGDVAVLEVVATDDFGVRDVRSNSEVEFRLEGPGTIIGCGNRARERGTFAGPDRAAGKMRNGSMEIAVRRNGGSGQALKVYASGKGLVPTCFILPRAVK